MAKDYAKVYRGENVMKRGIATYKDEAIFLSQDTLHRDMGTLKGRPVVIKHQNVTPENMEEKAVGYVTDTFYNNEAGTFGCKFVVFDDEAKELIRNGYSLSTCYKPTSFGQGGTEINTPYDREVTGLNFTHLALVPDPRYEDAKIYENGVMEMDEELLLNGGEGSGDFDHAGRPGEVGGSEPAGTGRKGKYTKSGGQNWVGAKPKQGKLFDEEEDDDKINKLIEMADSVSMFDSGSIEKREHEKNIQLIKELNISDDEKKEAIKKINNYHKMILEHLAKSPTSAKIGPAKFKDLHSKSLSHYEKALDLKSERNAILKNLEEKLKKEKTKQENKKLFEVSKEALEKGLLEFEHNGEIWFRKTKRRQGFTQLDDWSKKDYEEMKSKQKQNAIIEEQERDNSMENEKMEIPVSFFDKVMDLICNSKKEKKNEEIEDVIEEKEEIEAEDEKENKCKENEVVDKRDIIRQIMAIAGKKEASEDVKTIAKLAEKLAYDKDEAEKENAKEEADEEYNNDEFFNALELAKAKGESDNLPIPETQAKQIERGKEIFG